MAVQSAIYPANRARIANIIQLQLSYIHTFLIEFIIWTMHSGDPLFKLNSQMPLHLRSIVFDGLELFRDDFMRCVTMFRNMYKVIFQFLTYIFIVCCSDSHGDIHFNSYDEKLHKHVSLHLDLFKFPSRRRIGRNPL